MFGLVRPFYGKGNTKRIYHDANLENKLVQEGILTNLSEALSYILRIVLLVLLECFKESTSEMGVRPLMYPSFFEGATR